MQSSEFDDLHTEAQYRLADARAARELNGRAEIERSLRQAMELFCAASGVAPDSASRASSVMSAAEVALQLSAPDMALEFAMRALNTHASALGPRASVVIQKAHELKANRT